MQVWLPGNMVWDGLALQHRSPLPLPANCGLTAAAAGTIRRQGVAQVSIADWTGREISCSAAANVLFEHTEPVPCVADVSAHNHCRT